MKRLTLVAFLLTFISATVAFAANKTFSGPGNFADATKWNGNTLPGAGDNLKINGACTYNAATNLSYGTLNLGNPTAGQLTFNSGTTLTVTGISGTTAGSSISMTSGGTLVFSSTTGWPAGSGFTAGSGTVVLQGGFTLPSDVTVFNNLTISATGGTVTMGAALTVNGNLTISAGTFSVSASNYNVNVGGNFSNSSTFAVGSNTVFMNGSSSQTMTGATTFNNLTFNNVAGISLNSSMTATGTITLQNGAVTTGANSVIAASGATVSRTNGYVVGNLRKNVATGATSRTFEVGTSGGYTPLNVSFASVTTAGNLTASATSGDHPNIGSSSLDAAKSVNVWWNLTNSGVVFTTYDATFNYNAGDVDGGANTSNFLVGKYNSPNWTYPTVGTLTATSSQATGLTSFSDFAVGELISYTITATAGANGTITPSGAVSVPLNGSQSFSIGADPGYHIADVLVDGVSVGAVTSYNFTAVSAAHTISASFAINTFSISASAGANGSISPSGKTVADSGSTQSYTITPDAGYHVADVLVDGSSVGAVTSYDFTNVAANHTIDASFAINTFSLVATAGAHGSISPAGKTVLSLGGNQSYTITPDAGYHVADVLVDGVSVGAVTGYDFNSVNANHTIDASFAVNTFSINATAGANGSIAPAGKTVADSGSTQSYTITPNAGYHIADVLVDGVSAGAVASYDFTGVAANHTIDASFAVNTFSVSASADAHGSISPSGKSVYNYGDSPLYTMIPDTGYAVLDVLVDGVSVGAVPSYTFTNIAANHTIAVSWSNITFSVAASAGAHGSISPAGKSVVGYGASLEFTITPDPGYSIAEVHTDTGSVGAVDHYTFTNITANHTIAATFSINSYSIAATAGSHGTISPAGKSLVTFGDSLSFSIAPDAGYHIADVHVDTASVGAVDHYTFSDVSENHTIAASFAINSYSIAATAGANGTISPAGKSNVNYGDSLEYVITADPGYYIADVHVDTSSVGAVSHYTFVNVTGSHAISATFGITSYSIAATAGAHGTISPAGKSVVNYGDSLRFSITPDSGWYVADVNVDTVSVGAVSAYTFHHVAANHAISASFTQTLNPAPRLFAIAPSSGHRGESFDVTWHGTNFIPGVTSPADPPDLTFDSIRVVSDTVMIARVSIASNASLGFRPFHVVNAPPGGGNSDTVEFAVMNHAPGAARASAPVDHDTVLIDRPPPTITFAWLQSADLDVQDTVTYAVHVSGAGIDTTVSGLRDTSLTLGIVTYLQANTTYWWTVTATDGYATVASPDTFRFFATTATGIADGKNRIPKVYALHQNYPNPFNPTTVVQFDLPRPSEVTLIVYNLLGQEVAKLINHEAMSAGYQRTSFDGGAVPSGIYFYRITAVDQTGNKFVSVKKMMLVK